MDTDVMLHAPIDRFLDNRYFWCSENPYPAGWMMGAEENSRIAADLLSDYDDISFVLPDGTFDTMTNTLRIEKYLARTYNHRYPFNNKEVVELEPGVKTLPIHFFCIPEEGKENYGVHLYHNSWFDSFTRKFYGRLGRLEFSRFKRQKSGMTLPLKLNERLLVMIPTRFNFKKFLAITWLPRTVAE
jgi:hypothetical protein